MNRPAPPREQRSPTRGNRPDGTRTPHRATFAVLVAAVTAYSMIQSLMIPVLGPFAEHMNTDRVTATWLLTAYLLSASVFTPLVGRLGDIWGRDRALIASLLVLAVGSVVTALAPNIGWMIAGRAIQGAAGGIMGVSFGIIRDEFPAARIPAAIGMVSSVLSAGIGIGIVVAGPVVEGLGFTWLSWLPAIAALATAVAAVLVVPPSPTRTRERISIAPAVLLASWLVLLLVGISQAPQWGWGSTGVISLLVEAVVVAAAWIRVETVARVPLVDMQLMRRRPVWTANLVALLLRFGLYASSAFIPQLVQTSPSAGYGLGASVTESGLMMLPLSLVSFVAGLMAASGASRFGARRLIAGGCIVAAGGMRLLAAAHDAAWEVYLAGGLFGGGLGITMACVANLIVASVSAGQTGVASGMNANIRTIGGAIGSAALATVINAQSHTSGLPTESGYTTAFLIIAGVLILAAAVAALIPAAHGRS